VLDGGEAQISVYEFLPLLLPYEVESYHDSKQIHLSAFFSIYFRQQVLTLLQA
jgi:hypothetical protein